MNLRGHRGIAAMLMLLALVLSAMALLPAISQAQSYQITGLVSDCQTGLPVNAALVSLVDATGVHGTLTFTTTGSGTFSFSPSASNYTISVTALGHYPGGIVTPFRFDGTANVPNKNVCLYAEQGTPKGLKVSVSASSTPVSGAAVQVYNSSNPTGKVQFVTNGTTNATGNVSVTLWTPGLFEVRVYASGYQPYINTAVDMSTTTTLSVALTTGVHLVGWATDASGTFITSGVAGILYSPTAPSTSGTKVLTATVTGSFYSFNAPAGTYRMVVGAKDYGASEATVPLVAGPTVFKNVSLQLAPQETALTTVLFAARDWNNFTVWRNLTLNPDSTLPGLNPAGLRDLRMQINYTLGNGQTTGTGAVSSADLNAFRQWLLAKGPAYTTTDSFLLLNGQSFISTVTSYSVSVGNSLLTPGERVWINSSASYHLKSMAWIKYGQSKYYLNMTVFPDTNTTVYHNETYVVELPTYYEMVSDTILPNSGAITTQGFHNITVDPGLTGQAIRMVIERSLTGIARAKVIGPTGKFYVLSSTYQNYQAYVANNTNINFSAAETSNPPSNDSSRDNFTWVFLANGTSIPNPPNNVRYGIQPSFMFPLAGPYIVNLKAIGSGGNVSFRNITVWDDGSPPTANFRTNLTGTGSAIGANLQMNQGTTVRFDGGLSADQAYSGKTGVILNAGYAWDFEGDRITDATGRVVNWTFNKPGKFTVNLTVTDSVGWKGANASLTVTVNDTQAPVPGFAILDPTIDYAPAPTLTEGRNYTFNASKTTDNYDKLSALNFTWTIPGPIFQRTGTNNTFWGMNITFGWTAWNLSYPVKLVVRDTGFGSGKPNNGTYNQSVPVQIDQSRHPDLYIVIGSVKVSSTNPEAGQTITITLNVTNKPGWGPASQAYVEVTEKSGSQGTGLSPTWSIRDKNGNPLSNITSGSTATMTISVTVVGQGNKTLTITVADRNEPWTHVTSENTATQSIVVNQPAWVNYAIIGSVVAVFAVVIFAMYYRRKVKAGDWEPRFRRGRGGKDEEGKEKPRKEKEVKEEKKRL